MVKTCIQNYAMPLKERDFDNTVLSLRLTGPEAARFWRIMDTAKARNPYAGKSDIYRELLGLTPANALTKDEIHYFRTGEKTVSGIKVAPRSKSGIPLIERKNEIKKKRRAS